MNVTYDYQYEWGQGKENAIIEMVDFARYWADNEARYDFDYNIWTGLYGFVKVGVCLKSLAKAKVYQKKYKTFKQFCEKYLKISAGLAKQYIKASETWLELAIATTDDDEGNTIKRFNVLPQNISQTIPLTKLNQMTDIDGNSEVFDKWEQVLDYTKRIKKGKLTSAAVREVVNGTPAQKQIVIDDDLWSLIDDSAAKEGLSKKDFLRKVISHYLQPKTETTPVDNERIESWKEDLEDLLREHEESQEIEDLTNEDDDGGTFEDFSSPPEKFQSDRIISFEELASLVSNGEKTMTSRDWQESTVDKFRKLSFDNKLWIKAYNKLPVAKGQQFGWIRLEKAPYQKRLMDFTREDMEKEGLPGMSPAEYRDRYFPKLDLSDRVWVLEFTFYSRSVTPIAFCSLAK